MTQFKKNIAREYLSDIICILKHRIADRFQVKYNILNS